MPCSGRQEKFGLSELQQIAHKSMLRVLAGKHNEPQQSTIIFVAHRVEAVWNWEDQECLFDLGAQV